MSKQSHSDHCFTQWGDGFIRVSKQTLFQEELAYLFDLAYKFDLTVQGYLVI